MTAENVKVQQIMAAADVVPAHSGAETGAVDAWLRQALSARYDATLAEQLPAEMLTLLSGPH